MAVQPWPEALYFAVAEKNFCYVLYQRQQFKDWNANFRKLHGSFLTISCISQILLAIWIFINPVRYRTVFPSRAWICPSSRWGSWRRPGRSCARRGRRHSPSAQHEGTQHQVPSTTPSSPPVPTVVHHNPYRPISPALVIAVIRDKITIKTPNPKYVVTPKKKWLVKTTFRDLLVLLDAMCPVLQVEGLRTLPGVVVVGRHHSVAPFVVFVAFHRCCV